MDDYISKTKFEELMRKKARSNFDLYYADKSKHYHDKAIGYTTAADEVHDFPSEDVQPVNPWISVKDKLPDEGERVLIYAPRTQNQYYVAMFYTLHDEIKFAMNVYGTSYCWYAEDVTHWQPLLELPKDGDIE